MWVVHPCCQLVRSSCVLLFERAPVPLLLWSIRPPSHHEEGEVAIAENTEDQGGGRKETKPQDDVDVLLSNGPHHAAPGPSTQQQQHGKAHSEASNGSADPRKTHTHTQKRATKKKMRGLLEPVTKTGG